MKAGDHVFKDGHEEIEIKFMEGDIIAYAVGIDNPDLRMHYPNMRWITTTKRASFPYTFQIPTHETPQGKRVRAKLSDPLPETVQKAFFDHLQKNPPRIRLVYRTEVEAGVKRWFADNKAAYPDAVGLPTDIVASKSKLYTVAGSVTFLKPSDESILPMGLKYIPRNTQTEQRLEVNDVRLVVALNNAGFAINQYTREKTDEHNEAALVHQQ